LCAENNAFKVERCEGLMSNAVNKAHDNQGIEGKLVKLIQTCIWNVTLHFYHDVYLR
jgi:hypothetical protein